MISNFQLIHILLLIFCYNLETHNIFIFFIRFLDFIQFIFVLNNHYPFLKKYNIFFFYFNLYFHNFFLFNICDIKHNINKLLKKILSKSIILITILLLLEY